MSKNYYADRIQDLSDSVQNLLKDTDQLMIQLLDSRIQLENQNKNISSFLNDAAQLIKNEDADTRVILSDVIVKLKNYVSVEPTKLRTTIAAIEERRSAYRACIELISESKFDIIQHVQKQNRIRKAIEDGTVDEPREIGTRPEKLRDIRNTMSDIKTTSSDTTATARFSEENNATEQGEIAEENI